MQGLYQTIGRLASAAHANGDTIDENVYPSDEGQARHGLDVWHSGRYLRFRDVPEEPRFTVECPFLFSQRFRDRYTPEVISRRADIDAESLSPDDRKRVLESLVYEDLEEATAYEEEFRTSARQELGSSQSDIIRLDYEDTDLWNGVLVRDRLFPYEESFDVHEYRQAVGQVREAFDCVVTLLHNTVPPLNGDNGHRRSDIEPSGFE